MFFENETNFSFNYLKNQMKIKIFQNSFDYVKFKLYLLFVSLLDSVHMLN